MFRASRPVTIWTNVNSHKLETLWEDFRFREAQRQVVRLADYQLTTHVQQRQGEVSSPVNEVVNYDAGIKAVTNRHPSTSGLLLPHATNVVGEINKRSRPIRGSKWHNVPSPLNSVSTLECKLRLALRGDAQLVITLRGIP